MMQLTLRRAHGTQDYTHGMLFIDGPFFCHSLEDQERPQKIAGITAIPLGKYRIIINFSQRFKRNLILLLNVPGYEGIRMHSGNTAADTSGCVLVGQYLSLGKLAKSRDTYALLHKKVAEALQKDQDVWIEII